MHVSCPDCATVFRVPPRLLQQASGQVRCGCCGTQFDARRARVPLPPGAGGEAAGATATGRGPGPRPPAAHPVPRPSPPAARRPHPRAAPSWRPEEVLGLTRELQPAPPPPPRPAWQGLLLGFGCVALAGLLVGQLVLGLRAPLLGSAALRPWLEQGCAWVGCRLPALRDPSRVEILARDIRTHPQYGNGLLVDLTIVNRASFTQPFPVLQLTFTSLDEQWFAQRRFHPVEYLGLNRGTAERLPPDIPVQIVLELLDPGPEAVNFTFAFL